jgi:hypothetical protein
MTDSRSYPVSASPYDLLMWAADVAANGAKQCVDGHGEWHRGFKYAAKNTALGIAADLRRAALAMPRTEPIEILARECDAEMARLTGIIFDLMRAMKKIEDLALSNDSPAHKWGAAFAIATHTLHDPVSTPRSE